MVSYELILIISVQEHIFLLLEVAEESFEGDGLLLDSLFFLKCILFHKQFLFDLASECTFRFLKCHSKCQLSM